jgi:hypothetical protein
MDVRYLTMVYTGLDACSGFFDTTSRSRERGVSWLLFSKVMLRVEQLQKAKRRDTRVPASQYGVYSTFAAI